MALIVHNATTKKALREAAKAWNDGREHGRVLFEDPSVFAPMFDGMWFGFVALQQHAPTHFVVTNHPRRSWFAQVSMDSAGNVKVT